MARFAAFLRAINVGGHTVRMEDLRRLFESLGHEDVETFIASGNVVFTARARDPRGLEARIESHLGKALGYEVATFVRTGPEVAAIAAYRPFPPAELKAAGALNVGFLAEPLTAPAERTLLGMQTDIDVFHVHGRELYWLCRKKQSESTFSNVNFERALKVRATFRGMRTVVNMTERFGFTAA